jgi:hypothetical protein
MDMQAPAEERSSEGLMILWNKEVSANIWVHLHGVAPRHPRRPRLLRHLHRLHCPHPEAEVCPCIAKICLNHSLH